MKNMNVRVKHGHARNGRSSREYKTWRDMIDRCTNPNVRSFKDYGARGIAVCNEWMTFENFFRDMGEKPVGVSLERIENDKPYCKDNCRWATAKEQARNRRSTVFIEILGEQMTLTEASRKFDIPFSTLKDRIKKGMSPEEAVRKKKFISTARECLRPVPSLAVDSDPALQGSR